MEMMQGAVHNLSIVFQPICQTQSTDSHDDNIEFPKIYTSEGDNIEEDNIGENFDNILNTTVSHHGTVLNTNDNSGTGFMKASLNNGNTSHSEPTSEPIQSSRRGRPSRSGGPNRGGYRPDFRSFQSKGRGGVFKTTRAPIDTLSNSCDEVLMENYRLMKEDIAHKEKNAHIGRGKPPTDQEIYEFRNHVCTPVNQHYDTVIRGEGIPSQNQSTATPANPSPPNFLRGGGNGGRIISSFRDLEGKSYSGVGTSDMDGVESFGGGITGDIDGGVREEVRGQPDKPPTETRSTLQIINRPHSDPSTDPSTDLPTDALMNSFTDSLKDPETDSPTDPDADPPRHTTTELYSDPPIDRVNELPIDTLTNLSTEMQYAHSTSPHTDSPYNLFTTAPTHPPISVHSNLLSKPPTNPHNDPSTETTTDPSKNVSIDSLINPHTDPPIDPSNDPPIHPATDHLTSTIATTVPTSILLGAPIDTVATVSAAPHMCPPVCDCVMGCLSSYDDIVGSCTSLPRCKSSCLCNSADLRINGRCAHQPIEESCPNYVSSNGIMDGGKTYSCCIPYLIILRE